MNTISGIYSTVPVIATDDIEISLSYYINVLGFSFDFKYGEPPVYAGIKSANTEIYFSDNIVLAQAIKNNNLNPEIFIWVGDADALYKKHI